MAGHSKWANIKHKKDKADKQKGKIFSRLAKEIISAVKTGGPDPKSNPRLRLAIQKAKQANMPNDNVERNIKKASDPNTDQIFEQTYELYGHGGVGIIVEAMTDNKNRTASDLRIATNKRGGTIASPGSVLFNFDQKGIIQIKDSYPEQKVFEQALEAGAEDFEKADSLYLITTEPADLYAIKELLEKQEIEVEEASLEMLPKVFVECDAETAESNEKLIEWLEEIDDVDNVYHNMQ